MNKLLVALIFTLINTAIAESLKEFKYGCTIWCQDSSGYEQKGRGEAQGDGQYKAEYKAETNAKKLCTAKMYTNRKTSPVRFYDAKCWEIYKY